MADQKISQLPDGGTITTADQIPVVRSGQNRRAHVGALGTKDAAAISDVEGLQTALDGKAALNHTHAAGDITSGTLDNARVSQSNVTQHQAAINHQSIAGAGTNSHAQIDSHIADATKHRQINDSTAGSTDLWSAQKIAAELAGKADDEHTHAAADITDFDSAADARITAQKGVNSGLATLDAGGKLPTSQIPSSLMGALIFQDAWNASTNSPALTSGTGTKGHFYVVSVAGSTNLDGETDWKPKDWAVFNGDSWVKVDNTEAVTSVNGTTGAVVLGTDQVAEGSTNKYFTENRAKDAAGAALDDTDTIDLIYNAGTRRITATVKDGSIDLDKLGADVTAALNAKMTILVDPGDMGLDIAYWIEPMVGEDDLSGNVYRRSDYPIGSSSRYVQSPVFRRRYGGKMAVEFTADNFLPLPTIEHVMPCSIYLLVNQTGSNSGTKTLLKSDSGPDIRLVDGKPNVLWGGVNFSHSTAISDWSIITVTLAEDEISLAINGGTPQVQAHSESTTGAWIETGNNSFVGFIAAMLIYNDHVSSQDDADLITYLKAKGGIA